MAAAAERAPRVLGAEERRERLRRARLMLLFTPELCPAGRDPLEVLERALPWVDVVQVRIKDPELGTSPARATHDWACAVLGLVTRVGSRALVLVNDRVDVASTLAGRGLDGVHLGTGDMPPALARERLGPGPLIGLSTHSLGEVLRAGELALDYLGFGPVYPTATRGYEHGLGAEAAWVASAGSAHPLFPIGGIDVARAGELANVGRAAVSRAILAALDPRETAEALHRSLAEEPDPLRAPAPDGGAPPDAHR